MPRVEITVPEHLETRITQMIEEGEFVDRKEAVEELLTTGIKAFKTGGGINDDDPGFEEDGMMGHEDEYVF
jgi:metal-responsive CopG/Arc/MetJ family transcriptional regulator